MGDLPDISYLDGLTGGMPGMRGVTFGANRGMRRAVIEAKREGVAPHFF